MHISCVFLCVVLLGTGLPADEPARDRDEANGSLADQFAELGARFEAWEAAFNEEPRAASGPENEAREKAYLEGWIGRADEVRALIRAHPTDPDAFEGIILLPATMRSPLDGDLVMLVHDRFLDDPRMGRLAASLATRTEDWAREILEAVVADHPDPRVRGQATYSLGMFWRYSADAMILGRDRPESEQAECLDEAKRCFTLVATDHPDTISADDSTRLAEKAGAELARIANLPFLAVGRVAPEIVGEDLDGNPLKLSDHRGKVVVINFWATWCGPCMAMIPHERALVDRLRDRPFVLLGVNADEADDRQKARDATRDHRMTWPSWWDGGLPGPIQTAYDIKQLPTVYVLDPEGVIRFIDVRCEALDEAVDALLAEMESEPATETRE